MCEVIQIRSIFKYPYLSELFYSETKAGLKLYHFHVSFLICFIINCHAASFAATCKEYLHTKIAEYCIPGSILNMFLFL